MDKAVDKRSAEHGVEVILSRYANCLAITSRFMLSRKQISMLIEPDQHPGILTKAQFVQQAQQRKQISSVYKRFLSRLPSPLSAPTITALYPCNPGPPLHVPVRIHDSASDI